MPVNVKSGHDAGIVPLSTLGWQNPALVEAGLPRFAAEQVVTIFGALRDGAQSTTTGTVEVLTGERPTSFATFAHDYAAAFSAVPVGVPA